LESKQRSERGKLPLIVSQKVFAALPDRQPAAALLTKKLQ
jgi:hypothetical protein